ncbi:MAG: histidine--tRNA ligase [Chitinophagales bacterium]
MKPSIVRGTRDFGAEQVKKRQYIINIIRSNFEQFGYQPLETPVMEKLTTLLGKYGDEGDKLLYKVVNSGDFLRKASPEILASGDYRKLLPKISEKGLRYDLTIPFARYVVMNRGTLTFPYKRYQIQPVWRADKPQKGRYREFYQCDADVVGTRSLLNEAEFTQIYDRVFQELGIDVVIKLNNRKILAGIADVIGMKDKFIDMTIAIDKLDKIGLEGVKKELASKGIEGEAVEQLKTFLDFEGSNEETVDFLESQLATSEVGRKGVEELRTLFGYLSKVTISNKIALDLTLARGLNYYTGTIYEVAANGVKIGSIGGGGRYDDLTSTFGMKDVSGVGISFGLDRIYDVMNELDLFAAIDSSTTKLLFINFGGESEMAAFEYLQAFRTKNIAAELYPDSSKMKKQMKYANAKKIAYVAFVGEEERTMGKVKLKNMDTGEQVVYDLAAAIELLQK